MNNAGTQNINTERLLLRRVRLTDAEDVLYGWANDREVTRYLPWNAYDDINKAEEFLAFCLDQYEKNAYRWAIELKESGKVVGMIDVVDESPKIKAAHMGYALSRKYWNKGIMTEALKAVIDYLFNQAGYNRIEAKHHTGNPASGKVMLKCGMRFEGIRRHGDLDNRGNFCDVACYAVLKSDMERQI